VKTGSKVGRVVNFTVARIFEVLGIFLEFVEDNFAGFMAGVLGNGGNDIE